MVGAPEAERLLPRRGQATGKSTVGDYSYLYVFSTPGPRILPWFDGNRAFDEDQLAAGIEPREVCPNGRSASSSSACAPFTWLAAFSTPRSRRPSAGGPTTRSITSPSPSENTTRCASRSGSSRASAKTLHGRRNRPRNRQLPRGRAPGRRLLSPPRLRARSTRRFGPTEGVTGARVAPIDFNPLQDLCARDLRPRLQARQRSRAQQGIPERRSRADYRRARDLQPSIAARALHPGPPETIRWRAASNDALGLPLPEPTVPEADSCRPEPGERRRCARRDLASGSRSHLGPETKLYDLAFEGNDRLDERELAKITGLGSARRSRTSSSRRRASSCSTTTATQGFAYAEVRVGGRAVARSHAAPASASTITERERVIVERLRREGQRCARARAHPRPPRSRKTTALTGRTGCGTARSRSPRSGTFSSVSIALEDPEVPQKRKRVVITVVETMPAVHRSALRLLDRRRHPLRHRVRPPQHRRPRPSRSSCASSSPTSSTS